MKSSRFWKPSCSLHTKWCWLAGGRADICLSGRVMVAGPVTRLFVRRKSLPGTLGVSKEEEPVWGRQTDLVVRLFISVPAHHLQCNVKSSPVLTTFRTKFDLKCRHEFLQFWINLPSQQKQRSLTERSSVRTEQ